MRYLAETSHKSSQDADKSHLRWLDRFLNGIELDAIDRDLLDAILTVGIEDFRWHDLRHTWASWHAQAGTPLHVLQELGGWQSAEMVRKYAHLSSEHLAEYVDRMSGGLKAVPQTKGGTF